MEVNKKAKMQINKERKIEKPQRAKGCGLLIQTGVAMQSLLCGRSLAPLRVLLKKEASHKNGVH